MTLILTGLLLAAAGILAFLILNRRFAAYRGEQLIICPETKQAASVEVDIRLAAHPEPLGGPVFRLSNCSRWPTNNDCDQECVAQIAASPDGTLIRQIVSEWFSRKRCIYCEREIGPIAWYESMPPLRDPEGKLAEWTAIATGELPSVLLMYDAVCWTCGLIEDFRSEYPDLVTERKATPLRDLMYH
jgi:hypothetical protein